MDVIWTVSRTTLTGAERCTVRDTGHGWALSGVVAVSYEARPIDVQYRITVDEGWATRSVTSRWTCSRSPRQLQLERSAEGRWTVDGRPAPELDACVDVDRGISPSTNTLPIRRIDLYVGGEHEIDVAWVKFPDLRVERGRQSYARIAGDVWRYRSGVFSADLTVDAWGLVVRYGSDLWQRAAVVQ